MECGPTEMTMGIQGTNLDVHQKNPFPVRVTETDKYICWFTHLRQPPGSIKLVNMGILKQCRNDLKVGIFSHTCQGTKHQQKLFHLQIRRIFLREQALVFQFIPTTIQRYAVTLMYQSAKSTIIRYHRMSFKQQEFCHSIGS